jgi:hypothetical protein
MFSTPFTGAIYDIRVPSGDNCGPVFSGLPKSTSLGISFAVISGISDVHERTAANDTAAPASNAMLKRDPVLFIFDPPFQGQSDINGLPRQSHKGQPLPMARSKVRQDQHKVRTVRWQRIKLSILISGETTDCICSRLTLRKLRLFQLSEKG